MVEKRVGSIIIVKDDKPVGIVTESDMVAKVIFKNVKAKLYQARAAHVETAHHNKKAATMCTTQYL